MVLHVSPDGFSFDDDTGNLIIVGSRTSRKKAVRFIALVKTRPVKDVLPVYLKAILEKFRESPAEYWDEETALDVLKSRGLKVHSLEVERERQSVRAEFQAEGLIENNLGAISPEKVKYVEKLMRDFLWSIIDDLTASDLWAPIAINEDLDEIGEGFLMGPEEEETDEQVFSSLEFWWEEYWGDNGKP
ncbi:hypothetical protein TK0988 [Thermococcus kodakarensis KOD1]|uniref:Uncharacterized protein n=2 Tax=Thermococcus TaxID=2263 RepID=Q5JIC8_THEKO|nr:hypothetical protein TK0988 [Thermococcus kodakarensis KOD1]